MTTLNLTEVVTVSMPFCAYFLVRSENLTEGRFAEMMRGLGSHVPRFEDPEAPAKVSNYSFGLEHVEVWGFRSSTEPEDPDDWCFKVVPGIEILELQVNQSTLNDTLDHDVFKEGLEDIFKGIDALYCVTFYDYQESGETIDVRDLGKEPWGLMMFSKEMVDALGRERFESLGAVTTDLLGGVSMRFADEFMFGIPNEVDPRPVETLLIDAFQSVPELRVEGLSIPEPVVKDLPVQPVAGASDEEAWAKLQKQYRSQPDMLIPVYRSKNALDLTRSGAINEGRKEMQVALRIMRLRGPWETNVVANAMSLVGWYISWLDEYGRPIERHGSDNRELRDTAVQGSVLSGTLMGIVEHYHGPRSIQVADLHFVQGIFDFYLSRFADARQHLDKGLRLFEAIQGTDHPDYTMHKEHCDRLKQAMEQVRTDGREGSVSLDDVQYPVGRLTGELGPVYDIDRGLFDQVSRHAFITGQRSINQGMEQIFTSCKQVVAIALGPQNKVQMLPFVYNLYLNGMLVEARKWMKKKTKEMEFNEAQGWVFIGLAILHLLYGDLASARSAVTSAGLRVEKARTPHSADLEAAMEHTRFEVALMATDLELAEEKLTSAMGKGASPEMGRVLAWDHARLLTARARDGGGSAGAARDAAEDALKVLEAHGSMNDHQAFKCRNDLAWALLADGRHEQAADTVMDNVRRYVQGGGSWYGVLHEALEPLAMSYVERGEMDNAERVAMYAYRFDATAFGEDHYLTARDHSLLGRVFARKGNLEGALLNLNKAVEVRTKAGDMFHQDTYKDNLLMATMLEERGLYEESIGHWKEAHGCRWNLFEFGHPRMKEMKAHIKDLKRQAKLKRKGS